MHLQSHCYELLAYSIRVLPFSQSEDKFLTLSATHNACLFIFDATYLLLTK